VAGSSGRPLIVSVRYTSESTVAGRLRPGAQPVHWRWIGAASVLRAHTGLNRAIGDVPEFALVLPGSVDPDATICTRMERCPLRTALPPPSGTAVTAASTKRHGLHFQGPAGVQLGEQPLGDRRAVRRSISNSRVLAPLGPRRPPATT
jgi:hypothetical protein